MVDGDGGVAHALAEVHEPAGKRPQPAPGVDGPAREQHLPVLLGDGPGDETRSDRERWKKAIRHQQLQEGPAGPSWDIWPRSFKL